jgi:ParB-like chromosome segregation protein Spo0J
MSEQLEIQFDKDIPPVTGRWTVEQILQEDPHALDNCPKPSAILVRSIKLFGIREAIMFTQNGDGKLTLRDGRRRLAVARKLGIPTVPIKTYKAGSLESAVLTLDANYTRSNNPLAETKAITDIVKEYMDKQGQMPAPSLIAETCGLPVGTVKKRMRLLTLPDDLVTAAQEGKVALNTLQALTHEPKARQEQAAAILNQTGKLTGEDVHKIKSARAVEATAEAFAGMGSFLNREPDPLYSLDDIFKAFIKTPGLGEKSWMNFEVVLKGGAK